MYINIWFKDKPDHWTIVNTTFSTPPPFLIFFLLLRAFFFFSILLLIPLILLLLQSAFPLPYITSSSTSFGSRRRGFEWAPAGVLLGHDPRGSPLRPLLLQDSAEDGRDACLQRHRIATVVPPSVFATSGPVDMQWNDAFFLGGSLSLSLSYHPRSL